MAGRKRKAGPRYPSGDIRPTGSEIAPASIKRQMTDIVKLTRDKMWGTRITAHLALEEITSQQAASALKVRDIYHAYEAAKHLGRTARSPDYELQFKGDGGFPEPLVAVKSAALKLGVVKLDDLHPDDPVRLRMELILAVEQAWRALQAKIDELVPPPHTARWRAALEDYCVHDCEPPWAAKPTLWWMLDKLAVFFGIAGHKKGGTVGRITKRMAAPVARMRKPKRQDVGLRAVLKAAAPHLDDAKLSKAERLAHAYRDREAFRGQKAKITIR